MKKILSSLLVCGFIISAQAQWSPAKAKRTSQNEISVIGDSYKLDVSTLRNQLKNAQEMGPNSQSVEISIPTLGGKLEKFAVYSFPVMVKELADQYQLGSYIGVGVDDPTKSVRFSISPTEFQSMIIKNGSFEFIDPLLTDSSTYLVHPKTLNKGNKTFNCSTDENPVAINQLNQMLKAGKSFTNQPSNFAKSSDKKYRTMRLALSVTAEYTTFAGGTVAGALTKMNATMTRVNGVMEKDLALHLNIQNYPGIIYTNAATDPYSAANVGTSPANANNANGWNIQLQNTLTANVGDANYDIGHLFGQSGGGGNAGCIGCVCIAPTGPGTKGKGSGYTSPSDGSPQGDTFDIDYVAHEMGHQLGGTHTFSHQLESAGTNMEPGSGSTIMGYAGITGSNTDVQANSDANYHIISMFQIQNNLTNKTCDVETPVANNPPVIAALPAYTIPKGTAFVLTASATDPENDPLTYSWEQTDNATVTINKTNLGTTTTGASFRSLPPSASPSRYFPRLSSVLGGVLNNSNNLWEAVSTVARTANFAVTVRDNNTNVTQQQTQFAEQVITVGSAGPFTVTSSTGSNNAASPVSWNVAGTAVAPYSTANVKIDYTTNNGTSWTTLIASTPNDGSENVTFTGVANGTQVKLRVSAINNVFYAVNTVTVSSVTPCTGAAPTGLTANTITGTSANLSWGTVTGATYTVQYRPVGSVTWTTVNSPTSSLALTGLSPATAYEYQVLAICGGSNSPYSGSFNFTTSTLVYCAASSVTAANLFINNVTVGTTFANPSAGAVYSNFTTNAALQINLIRGLTYSMTISGNVSAANFGLVFIDYDNDGIFDASENILNFPVANASSFTGSFTVPTTALVGSTLRMRVIFGFAGSGNIGLSAPATWACGTTNFNDGEVEDYNVVVANNLSTSDISENGGGIQIYPNPTSDILNITKVSNKANYEIYSVAGQILRKGTVKDGKIVVRDLITGNYILKITDKDVEQSFKFIKR